MKGYVKESILYIFDHVPQDLSSVPDWEMPADIDKIYIQTEYVDGFKELNPDYADIMFGKNFCIMQYNPKPEEEHFEDDVNGHEIAITGDSSVHFTPSAWQALQNEVIIITPEDQTFGPGAIELSSKQATLVWNNTYKYWEFTMPDADVTIKCKSAVGPVDVDWAVSYDEETGLWSVTIGNTDTRESAMIDSGFVDAVYRMAWPDFGDVPQYKLVADDATVLDFEVNLSKVEDGTDRDCINLSSATLGLNINFYFDQNEWRWVEGNPSDDDEYYTFSAETVGETYEFKMKDEAPIYWSEDSATVTYGADDNVFPTLSNEEGLTPIYLECSDPGELSFDENGNPVLEGNLGTAAVYAMYNGNSEYRGTIATYELTVLPYPYEEEYLTFIPENDATFSFITNDLDYSLDGGENWYTLTAGESTPTVNAGEKILWRAEADNLTLEADSGIGAFSSTEDFTVQGNVMSLLYGDNFVGETDLSTDLPSGVLARLFMDNGYIINAENMILPATSIVEGCYGEMFSNCQSLTKSPKLLPATTLTESCYYSMFQSCTSLTTAPVLPATTLSESCYSYMFSGCTSLTTAPVLPATTLDSSCYIGMFSGCENITYIKCLASDISATGCTSGWVEDVSTGGTFEVNPYNTPQWDESDSGIPTGWTVLNYAEKYFTTLPGAGGATAFSFSGSGLEYSLDNGSTWTQLNAGESTPTIEEGDEVLWRGSNMTPAYETGIGTFGADNYFNVKGNIMSLLFGDSFVGEYDLTGYDNAFKKLFNGSPIELADNLILPATTLAIDCYNDMFNASGLQKAPELTAATTLAGWCCKGMFYGCEYLQKAPSILPATTLTEECYFAMFEGCSYLTKAPEISATTFATQSCKYMFKNCQFIDYIKCLATDITAINCTEEWVNGVAQDGTFVKNVNMYSWDRSISGIPEYWTVENTGTPGL